MSGKHTAGKGGKNRIMQNALCNMTMESDMNTSLQAVGQILWIRFTEKASPNRGHNGRERVMGKKWGHSYRQEKKSKTKKKKESKKI